MPPFVLPTVANLPKLMGLYYIKTAIPHILKVVTWKSMKSMVSMSRSETIGVPKLWLSSLGCLKFIVIQGC